jgi:DNA-binding NtrC family response regulator
MSEIRTILFVDDDEKVLKSLKRGLLDDPYNCLFANSGAEALEILAIHTVHVICTDMRMPQMNGLELLKIVKKDYPEIVRLVLSGYTQVGTLLTAINQGEIFKFITKPWKLEEDFKSVIQQAVDYYNLNEERNRLAAEVEKLKNAAQTVTTASD